jgi:hypothetical protein
MNENWKSGFENLDPSAEAYYRHAVDVLLKAEVPFLVGGAYALSHYTGIQRYTRDLDIFLKKKDLKKAMSALAAHHYRTEIVFPHWLAKAHAGLDLYIDLIFSSGNASAPVDELWFRHSEEAELLGKRVKVIPAEEMCWQKAYIMERERFDGGDVCHLLRARAGVMDWQRMLTRFGSHWRVLLSHIIIFGFVYPELRSTVPSEVIEHLLGLLRSEASSPDETDHLCQGTLLSREQYLMDICAWGYKDARIVPTGMMTPHQVDIWTRPINER